MVDVLDKDRQGLDPAIANILEAERADKQQAADDWIFCAGCSHPIARPSAAIEIAGQHTHLCVNPHGFAFTVRCFEQALGSSISGQPEAADSWFAGYTWRYANCANCATHLGWLFEEPGHFFYGLIKERIQT